MKNSFDSIPEHLKPNTTGTGALFQNTAIEKITRTHISVPVTIHLIIIAAVSYLALQSHILLSFCLFFIGGWLFWTFSEYWVHRYVYHVETEQKWLLKIQHMGHGIHHQYPKDATRLAMPPVPAILLLSVFYFIFWFVMRDHAIAFFPGFLFGYVLYISLHYAQHRFKAPVFGPLNRLWKNHGLHHYKFPETKAFGVSTRLWDWFFRTLPPAHNQNVNEIG